MGVNWKDMENVLRLYAADMAVNGAKVSHSFDVSLTMTYTVLNAIADLLPQGRDYKKMAQYFGQGTHIQSLFPLNAPLIPISGATYDTIEGKCRSIRKIAASLEEEFKKKNGNTSPSHENGDASQASITSANATTPKKAKPARNGTATPRNKKNAPADEKVLSGRVTKTPRKVKGEAKGKMVKQEDSSADADLDMDAEGVAEGLGLDGSFDFLRMEMEV